MSKRRLFLMRHAETEYFTDRHVLHNPDTPLTSRGRTQAKAAGEALRSVNFDRVVTSGALRTVETALLVTDFPQESYEVWSDFREIESGRLDTLSASGRERTFSTFLKGVGGEGDDLFGGENVAQLVGRVYADCERLRADAEWSTALAVLHGVVNRAILSWAVTQGGPKLFLGGFEQGPACVNVIDIGDDEVVVRSINYTPWDPLGTAATATTMEALKKRYEEAYGGRSD